MKKATAQSLRLGGMIIEMLGVMGIITGRGDIESLRPPPPRQHPGVASLSPVRRGPHDVAGLDDPHHKLGIEDARGPDPSIPGLGLEVLETSPGDDRPETRMHSGFRWGVIGTWLLCMGTSTCSSALILPSRAIWLDESAQMSGLEMGPIRVVCWLAFREDSSTGILDDRMPPLGYWAGWLWSRVFGLAECPMRWFSVACTTLATGLVFIAAYRRWGLASGLAAGLTLGLCPSVLDMSVEIRPYAMFLLESAAAFACLTGLLLIPIAATTPGSRS